MNRIDRLFAILLVLQKRDVVRAEDLATRFEISKRTVYRDVAALSEMGVPVISLPGEGYGLMPGYFLPPLFFTADEAAALVLGAQWLAQQATGRLPAATANALAKLTHVLPKATLQEVERLTSILRFYVTSAPFDLHDPLLATLQEAINDQQAVRILYHSLSNDEHTERVIEPSMLTIGNGAWYVEAYCRLRQDRRSFRLSRIEAYTRLSESFTTQMPKRRNLPKTRVVVRFTAAAARWVRERQHYSFVEERSVSEQYIEMIYQVDALYEIQLGIIDNRYAPLSVAETPAGAIIYWHVDDLPAVYGRLLALGAQGYQPITERGHGFVTASVVDPFGNILGVMANQHYLDVLQSRTAPDPAADLADAKPVLEIVHFRVKPGVDDGDVLAASAETQAWLAHMPGYLAREVSKNDDGQWIDIVHWRSLTEAQAAAQAITQQPCAANFMSMLDPEELTMYHVEQEQYFG